MTRLSVNINKFATLRNARGGNNPDILRTAKDIERYGAQGITVHPRPDERHIRHADVILLAPELREEFNIEGYPDQRWMDLVKKVKPAQATLVPDAPDALTSNAGWNTIKHASLLKDVISDLKSNGIRVSVFVDPDIKMVEGAAKIGADRIEFFTEPYAVQYHQDREKAVAPYVAAAEAAKKMNIGINAGHDLDLNNLSFLKKSIPFLDEVSIGHALICDAIYLGLENTIQMYLNKLANYE